MKLTIFTPLYNREHLIIRLYETLKRQTNKNFEWLIVDDGSTDESYNVAKQFVRDENEFSVRVYKQPNQGKHVAINFGVKNAEGDIFMIVDSDDYMPEDAVERIYKLFRTILNEKKIVGISAVKAYDTNQIVGRSFSKELQYVDITNLERKKKGILGDRAEVYYTSILKKYPFPVFGNEKFISEATVWNQIAYDGYKLRFYNDVIYYCEYLAEGLSKNIQNIFINNWEGYSFYVNNEFIYRTSVTGKMSIIFAYIDLAKTKKCSLKSMIRSLSSVNSIWVIFAFLLHPIYKIIIKIVVK